MTNSRTESKTDVRDLNSSATSSSTSSSSSFSSTAVISSLTYSTPSSFSSTPITPSAALLRPEQFLKKFEDDATARAQFEIQKRNLVQSLIKNQDDLESCFSKLFEFFKENGFEFIASHSKDALASIEDHYINVMSNLTEQERILSPRYTTAEKIEIIQKKRLYAATVLPQIKEQLPIKNLPAVIESIYVNTIAFLKESPDLDTSLEYFEDLLSHPLAVRFKHTQIPLPASLLATFTPRALEFKALRTSGRAYLDLDSFLTKSDSKHVISTEIFNSFLIHKEMSYAEKEQVFIPITEMAKQLKESFAAGKNLNLKINPQSLDFLRSLVRLGVEIVFITFTRKEYLQASFLAAAMEPAIVDSFIIYDARSCPKGNEGKLDIVLAHESSSSPVDFIIIGEANSAYAKDIREAIQVVGRNPLHVCTVRESKEIDWQQIDTATMALACLAQIDHLSNIGSSDLLPIPDHKFAPSAQPVHLPEHKENILEGKAESKDVKPEAEKLQQDIFSILTRHNMLPTLAIDRSELAMLDELLRETGKNDKLHELAMRITDDKKTINLAACIYMIMSLCPNGKASQAELYFDQIIKANIHDTLGAKAWLHVAKSVLHLNAALTLEQNTKLHPQIISTMQEQFNLELAILISTNEPEKYGMSQPEKLPLIRQGFAYSSSNPHQLGSSDDVDEELSRAIEMSLSMR